MTGPHFFAEALAEYEGVVVYYEACEEGLGARLVEEVEEAVALAMEFPGAASFERNVPRSYGLRWILLRSFPVKLVYTVRDDAFLVVAFFHSRRRPGYWLGRLRKLGL